MMRPLLVVLEDGQERTSTQIREALASEFSLTQEELAEMIPSGRARKRSPSSSPTRKPSGWSPDSESTTPRATTSANQSPSPSYSIPPAPTRNHSESSTPLRRALGLSGAAARSAGPRAAPSELRRPRAEVASQPLALATIASAKPTSPPAATPCLRMTTKLTTTDAGADRGHSIPQAAVLQVRSHNQGYRAVYQVAPTARSMIANCTSSV